MTTTRRYEDGLACSLRFFKRLGIRFARLVSGVALARTEALATGRRRRVVTLLVTTAGELFKFFCVQRKILIRGLALSTA